MADSPGTDRGLTETGGTEVHFSELCSLPDLALDAGLALS